MYHQQRCTRYELQCALQGEQHAARENPSDKGQASPPPPMPLTSHKKQASVVSSPVYSAAPHGTPASPPAKACWIPRIGSRSSPSAACGCTAAATPREHAMVTVSSRAVRGRVREEPSCRIQCSVRNTCRREEESR